jgi:hypothetical protein
MTVFSRKRAGPVRMLIDGAVGMNKTFPINSDYDHLVRQGYFDSVDSIGTTLRDCSRLDLFAPPSSAFTPKCLFHWGWLPGRCGGLRTPLARAGGG